MIVHDTQTQDTKKYIALGSVQNNIYTATSEEVSFYFGRKYVLIIKGFNLHQLFPPPMNNKLKFNSYYSY